MSARIGYFRVSTKDQSIESQRSALGGGFNKEFKDEGVSGAVLAADRPGFAALMAFAREGDTVFVYAVDRLGRDSIDIQQTVKTLLDRGISVDVRGLGEIKGQAGKLILAVLSQIAEMEKARIRERCDAGRVTAREHLAANGKTHKGKVSLGRRVAGNASEVSDWRKANKASIAKTAEHFKLSVATIKRYHAETSLQKSVFNDT
jgi:putative DNA-invertase from lambdoid prophage Rac